MKQFALFLFVTIMATQGKADTISVGVRAGIPFGEAFEAAQSRNFSTVGKNRFLIGPTLELRLPMGFGASLDALYRRYNFETTSGDQKTSTGAGQWEFPLMVRYRFPGIVARPFVGAGPVWQKITGITSTRNSTGLALGGGLDIKVPFLHITPELRYTRRFQEPLVSLPNTGLKANANQIDLVVGFTF